ncbi:MAG TPA: prolipoprotein diacylglyceryl transferase [Ignavibacteriales bacterium]|nr:prolipoprotein diacylglyceryl transferase [Ignavibacteriales bacterium]HOL81639.1 prolipoprotein diacylglyceryl transferase [Ignavibacteriales bacterium]HOM65180.1 prolipoprotein diacylglyceryl transferase [Ignavibacteriales bacterium]HPD66904.1 prolipoprotein diacylglyceryl transferase [Ignavibacteriales bacterium]HPP33753.1 prolipoprotein diacylglyceryl transferase [Ignavibacteriales bacterium]
MIPELFSIGPLTVYSYGLMVAIAFLVSGSLLTKEFQRNTIDQNIASNTIILAIVFGIIGARLFHVFENFSLFLEDPLSMIFSSGGLTYYGGLITVIIALYIYFNKKGLKFLKIADIASPMLALGYGIGRIGCHLAGDGDYGLPTTLPWGTIYANGTVKPSNLLYEYMLNNPTVAQQYNYFELSKIQVAQDKFGIITQFDLITKMHPTPIYEFLVALLIFWILWRVRKNSFKTGSIFYMYLILSGIARFLVEIIRLNPPLIFNLSEAQFISLILIILGIGGLIKNKETLINFVKVNG